MSQTIIDGVIARIPAGWRKLRRGYRVRVGDRQADNEGGWTTLSRRHVERTVGIFEVIIRKN